jgi:drug/metabolite transporter (DMT)-like permease
MQRSRQHPHARRTGLLLLLVMANIAMQLVNASIIKYATRLLHAKPLLVAFLLLAVIALSFGRFVVWGAMHKRFPVSVAYPATALFFPCVVTLAYIYGERVTAPQAMGAVLVSLGVLLLLKPSARPEHDA